MKIEIMYYFVDCTMGWYYLPFYTFSKHDAGETVGDSGGPAVECAARSARGGGWTDARRPGDAVRVGSLNLPV